VSVSGKFGAEPTVKFTKGITAKTTERTTVIEGTGKKVKAGDSAEVAMTIYNGGTTAVLGKSGYSTPAAVFTTTDPRLLPGLAKTIGCATVGSRVVSVIPAADAWGAAGNKNAGVAAGQSLVTVMDIRSVLPSHAWGAAQPAAEGLPKVTLGKDGTPSVTIPSTDAPTELKVEVLKKGDGAVVASNATITAQYQGVEWTTGKVFDESWGKGLAQFALNGGVIPGFAQAIAGQTVGSQVLAVIPPSLAYGDPSETNTNQLAGKTLVFVIDILAVN
jgi:peptidylprolyl isomerase